MPLLAIGAMDDEWLPKSMLTPWLKVVSANVPVEQRCEAAALLPVVKWASSNSAHTIARVIADTSMITAAQAFKDATSAGGGAPAPTRYLCGRGRGSDEPGPWPRRTDEAVRTQDRSRFDFASGRCARLLFRGNGKAEVPPTALPRRQCPKVPEG